uniref:Uncharacterized protein n=1 Tax=Saccharomyces paradoxus TaxID=27291 RepID=A0A1W5RR78_SACPA|nr:hypothetical protein [Saccharomyces paradoxus]
MGKMFMYILYTSYRHTNYTTMPKTFYLYFMFYIFYNNLFKEYMYMYITVYNLLYSLSHLFNIFMLLLLTIYNNIIMNNFITYNLYTFFMYFIPFVVINPMNNRVEYQVFYLFSLLY